jgi:hypothetical protein
MSLISSSAIVIDATLTRTGRRFLIGDDVQFNPVKFAIADDEVNYQLMLIDGVQNIDDVSHSITSLPISEPCTNDASEMMFKVYVNQTYLNQQFADTIAPGIYISSTISTGGQRIQLHSDDTTSKASISFNSTNQNGRSFISPYYYVKFDTSYDFINYGFLYPSFTTLSNDNWEIADSILQSNMTDNTMNVDKSSVPVSMSAPNINMAPPMSVVNRLGQMSTKTNNEILSQQGAYVFNKASKTGNNPYKGTPYGSPCIVVQAGFTETTMYHELKLLPENKQSIIVPNFVTITQLDINKQIDPKVAAISIPLEIINILW